MNIEVEKLPNTIKVIYSVWSVFIDANFFVVFLVATELCINKKVEKMGIKENYEEGKKKRVADFMEGAKKKASKITLLIIAAVFSILLLFWLSTNVTTIISGIAIIIASVILYVVRCIRELKEEAKK